MKRIIRIDASRIHSVDDFYDQIETTLDLKHFGRNLDALYDALSDGKVSEVVIEKCDLFRERLGRACTIEHYKKRIDVASTPSEKKFLENALSELEKGRGETMAERIVETIREISSLRLVLDGEGSLEIQNWQIDDIKRSLNEADRGEFASDEEVENFFKKYKH